ncbi:thiol reductant ABC exporter subunit CydD [Arsenicitalea aurantiaca]|uniref:Thiol reductant ABC exporter subunit CydD n=1 Tax=Arsenicitalea aurantiaca TaxID=1783274 RepID=A0A433XM42_9HYPH|nr:thiol reductant ABC exporter subunit CydD [Arsenicitalea aurantiaca]RUT35058.1 thiol reductant ABC exporter subunit CydD [Arsenicitalea aurantiaca]
MSASLALGVPLLSGLLLIPQAWLLALVLGRAIADGAPIESLHLPIAGIALLVVFRAALGLLSDVSGARASEAIKARLRTTLFAGLLSRGTVWTASRPSGALSGLVLEQVEALDGYFARYMPAMVQAAVLPIAFAAIIMPVDWIVGLLFLVTAPLIPVFMMLAGWGAEAASRAQARALLRLGGRFADRLRGLVTLKLLGRQQAETDAIHETSEALRRRSMVVMRIAFLSSAVLEFFAALGVAGVALYVGLTFLDLIALRADPLTLQAGLFCLLMAPEIYNPLRLLAAHYHDRATAKAAAREIESMLGALPLPAADVEPAIPATPNRPFAPALLSLKRVAISDPEGRPLLEDVSLALRPGQHLAILGPSGSGKSTLLEAIARLRPHGGEIVLDGWPLDRFDEAVLRRRIGFLGQRPRLISGTIAENIAIGRPDACGTAIRLAAERACVTDFSAALPRGLGTLLGENGLGLSGGEIQRVALARLYLRDPGLILLDEPTAHLDAETEMAVLDGLQAFAAGRTMIVATHSLAVAARMDLALRIAGRSLLPTPHPTLPASSVWRASA